jgi:hypothetical protein
MGKLDLYNKYREVPKDALKAFDNGKFKGTDINTMWRIKSLTEEFGPCGLGWYPEIVRTWSEQGAKGEVLAFAEINLYVRYNDEWSKGINATGGSKLVEYAASKDYHKSNDEGYKMAITDALGVACKLLGFGADVYWANDKTKYTVDDTKQEQEAAQNQTVTEKKGKLSKKGFFEKHGYLAFEKECASYDKRLGNIPFEKWGEEHFEVVEEDMKERHRKRERQAQLSMVGDADIPFPMAGEYVEGQD